MTIEELIHEAWRTNEAKGWHEPPKTFGEDIALCHSELSEALEEHRNHHAPATVYFKTDEQGNRKPEGIPIELADVLIRIADMCQVYGINLTEALWMKLAYNRLRPVRHGGRAL